MSYNDVSSKNPPHLPFHATLACGHVLKLRNEPMAGARFACRSGLGCGYRLDWKHCEDTGQPGRKRKINHRYTEEKQKEK